MNKICARHKYISRVKGTLMCSYYIFMCFSVESSLKTTSISLLAIVYLLTSKIPHFQWIGIGLIGWCGMQFAELLLWLTEPRKGCTLWNKIITMTLIPLVLMLQPLGFLFGSLFVIPWDKSSDMRKKLLIFYTLFIVLAVSYTFYYKPSKICTTVTESGHLYWSPSDYSYSAADIATYFLWAVLIILPIVMFWNKSYAIIVLLIIIPTFGLLTGLKTDSRASIWCHYTSYTSMISIAILFAQQVLNIKLL